ncbi:hypothetical protein CMUS01_10114 [Colletotrichum musicola]|uniref:Uncharacterized protein n=1 Tax=Colletotrichum musicola TaxID=2175873 RepID=A0A8H6N9K5_9PEZI|nr:hypothetical protein CMUS01_10114 [Colletotrichum musicola]
MGNMLGTGGVHDELGAGAKLFGDAARERGAIGLKKQRGGLWLDAMNEDGDVVFEERRATMLWSMPCNTRDEGEEGLTCGTPENGGTGMQRRGTYKVACLRRRRRYRGTMHTSRAVRDDVCGQRRSQCEERPPWVDGLESLPFSPTERQYDVSATEEHDDVNSHPSMFAPSRVGSAAMPTAATTIAVTPLSDVDTRRKTGCEEVAGGRGAPISKPQGGVSATASFWCGPAVFAEEKAEGASSSPTNI